MSRILAAAVLALGISAVGCSAKPVAVKQAQKLKTEVVGKTVEKAPKPSPYIYKVERPVRPVTTASREPAPKLRAQNETIQPQ